MFEFSNFIVLVVVVLNLEFLNAVILYKSVLISIISAFLGRRFHNLLAIIKLLLILSDFEGWWNPQLLLMRMLCIYKCGVIFKTDWIVIIVREDYFSCTFLLGSSYFMFLLRFP